MSASVEQRPLIHVVSYLAQGRFDPRGVRTRRILEALRRSWRVDLISGPVHSSNARSPMGRGWDYALYGAHAALAIDRYETWSARRLLRWQPDGGFALLIGYPFSPLAYAAYALRRAQVPYVVDIGDPWALTARALDTRPHSAWRGRRAERTVLQAAAGAVLTTRQQSDALTRLFPSLAVLVRPNGYDDASSTLPRRIPPPENELHLGHFGRLYSARINIVGALGRLAGAGRWRRVVLHQYGDVSRGVLESLPSGVEVIKQPARPWPEVQAAASRLSAALAIGNLSSAQLPSKVVDYLTLPIPRIALVRDPNDDAIIDYLSGKRGWLVAGHDVLDLADQVAAHVGRSWSEAELSPPADEAWPRVAEQISAFVSDRFRASFMTLPTGCTARSS